ncbi:DUF4393 domain-containing protein [Pectobacterium brasiliense]|uniref:DUF4393 domain-containing protein n=1 Tax=Pectobacterium brasiliense TaxID=180957 RepID=UPI001CE12FE4|nr:DUF4393 domain-containing protein [Pectobacterium brasiliense]MCA5919194.1 DUF4393 domain-containing protein [Pectobacterium brasiliense]MCA5926419.1 DUF4393 domain-containing protein [Pectobacterium brasiliense]MCA5935565.1 DUF4393 domain-containing protein [Pectobacterium brasiliense]MCA5941496.1 DUF4393 domain-containing protein [Pectobacterium brasiliense]MCA5943178.1 DUF4393 domain-containing protein [Pectobacterium brasiliense]
MTDENTSENDKSSGNNKVAETINAVTGLTQSIPVYQDLIQPAAQELGKGLAVIAKSVNVALAPLSVMVWSYEKIREQFIPKVAEKLKDTKPEDIITPKPNVAVPAIEALRYTADDESLSDLFAGLLASAMDKNKADNVHPSFVEIIKQLTGLEAKFLIYLRGMENISLVDVYLTNNKKKSRRLFASNFSYFHKEMLCEDMEISLHIDNLDRLKLIEIRDIATKEDGKYKEIIEDFKINYEDRINEDYIHDGLLFMRKNMKFTMYGAQFLKSCANVH